MKELLQENWLVAAAMVSILFLAFLGNELIKRQHRERQDEREAAKEAKRDQAVEQPMRTVTSAAPRPLAREFRRPILRDLDGGEMPRAVRRQPAPSGAPILSRSSDEAFVPLSKTGSFKTLHGDTMVMPEPGKLEQRAAAALRKTLEVSSSQIRDLEHENGDLRRQLEAVRSRLEVVNTQLAQFRIQPLIDALEAHGAPMSRDHVAEALGLSPEGSDLARVLLDGIRNGRVRRHSQFVQSLGVQTVGYRLVADGEEDGDPSGQLDEEAAEQMAEALIEWSAKVTTAAEHQEQN